MTKVPVLAGRPEGDERRLGKRLAGNVRPGIEPTGWLVTIMALSAFGPYLVGGVRTDQFFIYLTTALLLPFLGLRLGTASAAVTACIVGWSTIVAVALVGWLFPAPGVNPYGPGSALANFDNLAMPLAVIVLTVMVVPPHRRRAAVGRVAGIVVGAMCLNAVAAIIQVFRPLDSILSHWWSGGGLLTTAERAITLGRFTGFIGQPVVTGLLYGVALVCALYVLRRRPWLLAGVALLLTVGGVLTVSKAFLLLGLPVAGWQFLRIPGGRSQRVAVLSVVAVVATLLAGALGMLDRWRGVTQLRRLIPVSDGEMLTVYLGGRFGEGSSTRPIIDTVMQQHPVLGFGMPGLNIFTDTAWVQSLVLAGLVGALAFTTILLALVVGFLHRRGALDEPERRLCAGLVVLAVAGSFATPALTANRLSVVLWIMLTLLLSAPVVRDDGAVASPERPT